MFKVTFIQHIHSGFAGMSSSHVWLEYVMSALPFPPYKGLTIVVDREKDFQIELRDVVTVRRDNEYVSECEIYFDYETSEFQVYLPSDKTRYWEELDRTSLTDLKMMIKEYTDLGWKVKD